MLFSFIVSTIEHLYKEVDRHLMAFDLYSWNGLDDFICIAKTGHSIELNRRTIWPAFNSSCEPHPETEFKLNHFRWHVTSALTVSTHIVYVRRH